MKRPLNKEMTKILAPLQKWADADKENNSLVVLAGDGKEHSVLMKGDYRNMAELLANCFASDADLLQISLLAVMAINKKHQKKEQQ